MTDIFKTVNCDQEKHYLDIMKCKPNQQKQTYNININHLSPESTVFHEQKQTDTVQ